MEEISDPSEAFLDSTRFWIQRVFVPIMVAVGVGGNTLTVMVLTRKRMRSSTNIYLTALAVADLVYLLFVLSLSFKVYDHIHDKKYELYWRFYGLIHWLVDAASSASVWLTVSFTLERYIAVCHPIKGKVICTENRAKSIIVIVSIFCILTTASTTFEYELAVTETCVRNCTRAELTPDVQTNDDGVQNETIDRRLVVDDVQQRNETCCVKHFSVTTIGTHLAENRTYQTIISWYSAITFGLLPLVLIATFNCFLINAVYRSLRQRRKMTSDTALLSNENRITVMLIAVVILFLLCQTPTASFLIYTNFYEPSDQYTINVQMALGNIFNFLLTVNASCNFLMYCVLSRKYRTTFKTIFCERKAGSRQQETSAMLLSSTSICSRPSPRIGSNQANGFRRNVSEYRTPRGLETQSLTSIPRSKSLMMRLPGKAKSTDINV